MTFVAAPQWAVHSYTTRGRIYKHTHKHIHTFIHIKVHVYLLTTPNKK